MQSKKTYIVLIVILFVFFIVMFLAFGLQGILKNRLESTLIVGNHTVWTYHNQKWQTITDINEIKKMNWQLFELNTNHENRGTYYLWHDDQWYAFDKEKNPFSIQDNFIAYKANYDMNVLPFTEEKIKDTMYVANVLKQHNISLSSKLTTNTQVSIDFDQDGEKEDFYAVSNAFSLDSEPDTIFSFAFMVKNQTIYMIYEDVRNTNFYEACKPFFTGFLDANHNQKMELILSCGGYSITEQKNTLYEFQENAFKIVISNE